MHAQNVPHQTNMTRDISEAFPQASALVAVQNVSQLQNVSSFNLCSQTVCGTIARAFPLTLTDDGWVST